MNDKICPLSGEPCLQSKVVHVTDVNGDKVESKSLCEKCAANYLLPNKAANYLLPNKEDKQSKSYDLISIFTEFLDFIEEEIKQPKKNKQPPVALPQVAVGKPDTSKACPNCKITLKQIAEGGRLGCVQCYDFFGAELAPVFKVCQGPKLKHVGKVPSQFKKKMREESRKEVLRSVLSLITHHQIQLKAYISKEQYEDAAIARDKIIRLQTLRKKEKSLQEILQHEQNEKKIQQLKGELQELLEQAMEISNH